MFRIVSKKRLAWPGIGVVVPAGESDHESLSPQAREVLEPHRLAGTLEIEEIPDAPEETDAGEPPVEVAPVQPPHAEPSRVEPERRIAAGGRRR